MENKLNYSDFYKGVADVVAVLQGVNHPVVSELMELVDCCEDVEKCINDFDFMVSKYTRRDNRTLMQETINSVTDIMNNHFLTLHNFDCLSAYECLDYDFYMVMEETRSKPLYFAGDKLEKALINYDKKYQSAAKTIKRIVK